MGCDLDAILLFQRIGSPPDDSFVLWSYQNAGCLVLTWTTHFSFLFLGTESLYINADHFSKHFCCFFWCLHTFVSVHTQFVLILITLFKSMHGYKLHKASAGKSRFTRSLYNYSVLAWTATFVGRLSQFFFLYVFPAVHILSRQCLVCSLIGAHHLFHKFSNGRSSNEGEFSQQLRQLHSSLN